MSDPVSSAAGTALQELLEVSPQVDAAVVLSRSGGDLVASAPSSHAASAARLGTIAVDLVAAAERSRVELGREPVSQIEVSTPDGHVFVVTDAAHVVAAVTAADPTVGLVFYDLKTALRAVREATPVASNGNGVVVQAAVEVEVEPSTDEVDATTSGSGREGRWRRRKS